MQKTDNVFSYDVDIPDFTDKRKNQLLARKLIKTKLYSRNLIKGINSGGCPPCKKLGLFLKWMKEELREMDQRTSKLMTMHKTLHLRDDIDRLYMRQWKEEEDKPALGIVWVHQIKESIKKSKTVKLWQKITTLETQVQTEK